MDSHPAPAPSPALLALFRRGLLSIEPNMLIKNKGDLSVAYTPGVGHVCTEIVREPGLFYAATAAEDSLLLFSSGDLHAPGGADPDSPAFMLPELEVLAYAYKALANVNAFPLVFRPSLVPDGDALAFLVEHVSEAVVAVELHDVVAPLAAAAAARLARLDKVVVMPGARGRLESLFAHLPDPRFLAALVLGVAVRVASKLHLWGVMDESLLEKAGRAWLETEAGSKSVCEFDMREAVLAAVRAQFDPTGVKLAGVSGEFELQPDRPSPWIHPELFFHDFSPSAYNPDSVFLHRVLRGMIRVVPCGGIADLRGFLSDSNWAQVREVGRLVRQRPELEAELTLKRNYCAIATNGTAILGLGDIGARAGTPVMEGKICLFRQLGHVNVMPLCLSAKRPEDVVWLLRALADSWTAINLEDIAAPVCFTVEAELDRLLPYPVFHDDQHGTAIVCLAGLINALRVARKAPVQARVLVNGAGAAGKSVTDLLIFYGFRDIVVCDTRGLIFEGRDDLDSNEFKKDLAGRTNRDRLRGHLADGLRGRDVFVGVSAPHVLTEDMVRSMAPDPIVFALANPVPEIEPELARRAGALVVATGRSDHPNQINNSIVFPGVFRAIVDGRIRKVTMDMKRAAAEALSQSITDLDLGPENILPYSLDPKCARIIANSLRDSATAQGLAGPLPKL